jgi:hypothetical protein
MDMNKFVEAARYMNIIEGYERDLELLEQECNPAKIVLFKDGGIVSEINDLEIRNQVRCFLRRKIDYYQLKFYEL